MKKIIIALALLVFVGCSGDKESRDNFITIDVTKSYPRKELILPHFCSG